MQKTTQKPSESKNKADDTFAYDEKNIGVNLRRAITDYGMSVKSAARNLAMKEDEWKACESGKTPFPLHVIMESMLMINDVPPPEESYLHKRWNARTVGDVLIALRKDRKWTIKFICEELRVPTRDWTRCENGIEVAPYELLCRLFIYTRKNRKKIVVDRRRPTELAVIGERIKEMRKKKGFSQQVMAEQIGVTQANWSDYEKGKTLPPLSVFFRIKRLTYFTIEYMIGLTNSKTEFNVSGYELARTLSNILLYAGVSAKITKKGELVLSVNKNSKHGGMIKSIFKQTVNFVDRIKESSRGMSADSAKINQGVFLHEMREYGRWDLTEKCERYFSDDIWD